MKIVVATCLLFVCGINAAIYYDRYAQTPQSFNQFKKRMQRSIGFSYPHGHLYNPIEPSSNDVFEHVPDSRIDGYRPPAYWPFANPSPVVRDTYPVHKLWPYRQTSSIFDAEFGPSSQYVPPHRLAPEDIYKNHLSSSSDAYRQQPAQLMPAKPNVAIQLLATANIFHGYRLPLSGPALQAVRFDTPDDVVFERPSQTPDGPVPGAFQEQPTVIVLALPFETPAAQEPTPLPEGVPVVVPETGDETTAATTGEPIDQPAKEIVGFVNVLDPAEWNVTKTESAVAVGEPSYVIPTSIELGSSDDNESATTTSEEDESTSVTTESVSKTVLMGMNPTEDDSNGRRVGEILQAENEPSSTTASENSIAATEISGKLLSILVGGGFENDNSVTEKQGRGRENAAYQRVTVDNISAEFPSDTVIMEYPGRTLDAVSEYSNENDD